ncbi:MAG TPA: tetratricopeptide repeat protein [Chloroflexota bacterium]|nr:tetratricopeptide repeat protein [Chloroflexota bacterium]
MTPEIAPKPGGEQAGLQHALQYVALAESLEPELWGPNLVRALDSLEQEHDNLRTALCWCVNHGEAAIALRLSASLWRFWQLRGHLAEGLNWLDEALALPKAVPTELRARGLEAAGNLARSLGRYEKATVFYAGSLQARLKLGDKRGIALALTNLGVVAQLGGNDDASVAHHDASFELFRELGDPAGVGLSLITLGTMAQLQGRTASARALYEESLALFRAVSDTRGIAASLNNLANTVSEAGEFAAARSYYEEALNYFRELGDAGEEAACLKNLALMDLNAGAPNDACRLCQQSLELFDELADGRGVAACLDILARIAHAKHEDELAARILGAAEGLRDVLLSGLPATGTSLTSEPSLAIREVLGEEHFAECLVEGRMMSLADVISSALSALQGARADDLEGGTHAQVPG